MDLFIVTYIRGGSEEYEATGVVESENGPWFFLLDEQGTPRVRICANEVRSIERTVRPRSMGLSAS